MQKSLIPGFREVFKIADIELDGDRFVLALPPHDILCQLISKVISNLGDYNNWRNFWVAQKTHYILCGRQYSGEELALARQTILIRNINNVVGYLRENEFRGGEYALMPILIPVDEQGIFDADALVKVSDFTVSEGGCLFVDGNPVEVNSENCLELDSNVSCLSLQNFHCDGSLKWFVFRGVLIAGWTIRLLTERVEDVFDYFEKER